MTKMKIRSVLVIAGLWASSAWATDLTGDWTAERQGPNGEARPLTLHLRVEGSTLTGTVSGFGGTAGDAQITDGSVNADTVSFGVLRGPFRLNYEGKITGEIIQFKLKRDAVDTAANPNSQTEQWSAHRAGS